MQQSIQEKKFTLTREERENFQRIHAFLEPRSEIRLESGKGSLVLDSASLAKLRILIEQAVNDEEEYGPESALSMTQAATWLGVSRPFLVKAFEEGDLSAFKVGEHHYIKFGDLLEYRDRVTSKRRQVLEEMAAEAQELGLGY
ncbi:MAG: helix-turn-helix domain-containing protein [Myxococcota bacterium]